MRALVACLLLVTLLPLPSAQAASWSVDAIVDVKGSTDAELLLTVTGLGGGLTMPIPDNATFLNAYDARGALTATVSGDKVTVNGQGRPFTARFSLEGEQDGPFVTFPAQVAAADDSPVSVRTNLPHGWVLSGWRMNESTTTRSADGVFHATGPTYVELLALPQGALDTGPDLRAKEELVLREGWANVTGTGTRFTITTTYDTDLYSRNWNLPLPPRATLLGASTPFGPLEARIEADDIVVRAPYPDGFGLGGRAFTVTLLLPAPDTHGGAFRQANLSIAAKDGDAVALHVALEPGATYTGARASGAQETEPLTFLADGPLAVGVGFLPPAGPGVARFTEGPFVVEAPVALEAAARATARNASELLASATSFLPPTDLSRPFYVAYTHADIFHWEEGFYSHGLNTISIRASSLANATDGRARLDPVKTLIHEATHGLVDRALPDAPDELSLLHEGLSRLAETRVEDVFADEVVTCQREAGAERCVRHSSRPEPDELHAWHRRAATLPLTWGADAVSDADRGFLYDYSGIVFRQFDTRAPSGALQNALVHLQRQAWTDEPAADAEALVGVLLANAPGASRDALLYPARPAASLPLDSFRACAADLVAPPYPWEEDDIRAPPGGCPASGYGDAAAALPTPPPPTSGTTPSFPEPVQATPPTRPVATAPTLPADEEDVASGEAPGAVAAPGEAPVPLPAALLLVALLVVALARRR